MKILRKSLPDEVCERIKENIKDGTWKEYERIPSENELSEMFGVNRLTIRMALQKLNTLGIVETRVGEGTFVKRFSFSKYVGEITDFIMEPDLLEDVCEFRELLEVECARLAIERATPERLEELKTILDEYYAAKLEISNAHAIDHDMFRKLVELDLRFHQCIVRMAKNSLFSYSFIVAKESILQHLLLKQRADTFKSEYKSRITNYNEDLHRVIYQAIVDKDFETCKSAYLEMIGNSADL